MRVAIAFALSVALAPPTSARAQWTNSVSQDEMTGKKTAYARSPLASPTRAMDFPYADTEGTLGFACDGEDEWAFVTFTNSPNLTDTETGDGYNTFTTRVKWNDDVQDTKFLQKWGESSVHFRDYGAAIKHIEGTSGTGMMVLELHWYGNGAVYFRFSMEGASDALAKARAACKK